MVSFVIVTMNAIGEFVFEKLSRLEMHFDHTQENKTLFFLIFMQVFFQTGIILGLSANKFAMQFDSEWFIREGTSICMNMIMLTFSSYCYEIGMFILFRLQICYDQSCKCRMTSLHKKKQKKKHLDTPNTRQIRQQDLNKIYTGPQIRIGIRSAYTFVFIFVILMYSSTIPLLYPIGMMFFFITYWLEKFFFFHYYQKSTEFDEELPIKSLMLIKYAIILHIVLAIVMNFRSEIFSHGIKLLDWWFIYAVIAFILVVTIYLLIQWKYVDPVQYINNKIINYKKMMAESSSSSCSDL